MPRYNISSESEMAETIEVPVTADATVAAVRRLPDRGLGGDGPVQDAFRRSGIGSFHDACLWVHRLPYGEALPGPPVSALLTGLRGTCTTKHAAIAALAAELRLAVQRQIGFYRMDAAMVPGIDTLLTPLGLSFVPAVHCFLDGMGTTIDLTAGNRDGRAQPIRSYDFVVPVAADATRDDVDRLFVEHLPRYHAIEPKLAAMPTDAIVALVAACRRRLHARAG